jgi:hypothetical protein
MPNEIKLDEVGSYLSWSRRGMLILRTKSMERYILGKVLEPEDNESCLKLKTHNTRFDSR